jgi:RimJ/RimL family protein N-acetyltransferase
MAMVETRIHTAPRRYSQLPRFFRWFSDHCVLRQIDESDVSRVVGAASHEHAAACASMTAPGSHGEALKMVQTASNHWMRGTRYTMAVLRKQTHDFVGWIELSALEGESGAWNLDVFVHPNFAADAIAVETVTAAADLMFSALGASKLYAGCPRERDAVEHLFNEAGFIELIPAGVIDPVTAAPRTRSLLELGRGDWIAMRRAESNETTREGVPYASNWVTSGMTAEFVLN